MATAAAGAARLRNRYFMLRRSIDCIRRLQLSHELHIDATRTRHGHPAFRFRT
jgi:hypothetical protein